jgi:hypothetical protein
MENVEISSQLVYRCPDDAIAAIYACIGANAKVPASFARQKTIIAIDKGKCHCGVADGFIGTAVIAGQGYLCKAMYCKKCADQ